MPGQRVRLRRAYVDQAAHFNLEDKIWTVREMEAGGRVSLGSRWVELEGMDAKDFTPSPVRWFEPIDEDQAQQPPFDRTAFVLEAFGFL